MATVSETIPPPLQPEVAAALDWFNATQAEPYQVTGILDAELTLAASAPRELRLVLCGGDTCLQRSFRVSPAGAGFEVAGVDAPAASASSEPQAELDPPPGARRGWLDAVLREHAFVLLVFYRGFW